MFPQFTIFSTPLLILVLQGLIFFFLLLRRYQNKRVPGDLLIAIILLVMAYHRSTYTLGFMGWYDTFKNSKINYLLLNFTIAMGPLIYLYVRTVVRPPFKLHKKDWLHFIPAGLYIIYKLILYIHDAGQPGFETGYEGEWKQAFDNRYFSPFYAWAKYSSQILYLAFSFQLFFAYRRKIREYFSNSYKVELNWLSHFLYVYASLFVYTTVCVWINEYVTPLGYKQFWWGNFFSAIAIVYLGVRAYYTDIINLQSLTHNIDKTARSSGLQIEQPTEPVDYSRQKEKISSYLEGEKVYLNPNLTLKDLAEGTGMSLHDVSETINSGIGVSFREFINGLRVEEVKQMLQDSKNNHLSLLAIALDCGFNSKATFNRVFKAITGQTPSEYKQELG